jgi:hypothetical protein
VAGASRTGSHWQAGDAEKTGISREKAQETQKGARQGEEDDGTITAWRFFQKLHDFSI